MTINRALPALIASLLMLTFTPAPVAAEGFGQIEDPSRPDAFYCAERKLGSWFYCAKPKPKPKAEAAPALPPAQAPSTAAERLDAVTAELRELKARAILEPTPDNVQSYIRFQREQLDRSSLFADVWQRAVWQEAKACSQTNLELAFDWRYTLGESDLPKVVGTVPNRFSALPISWQLQNPSSFRWHQVEVDPGYLIDRGP